MEAETTTASLVPGIAWRERGMAKAACARLACLTFGRRYGSSPRSERHPPLKEDVCTLNALRPHLRVPPGPETVVPIPP